MLFQTTQAYEELHAKIRAFAETEVKPNAILMDQESRFPAEAIKKFAEMGLMGIRSSETCQLNFDDVKVPKENLLGKEGQDFKIAMSKLYASETALEIVNDAVQIY